MYGAKAEGRRTHRFFEPVMDARAKARLTMEQDLRQAMVDGGFDIHYQPLLDLGSNEVTGCEALLRWRHPERGMVSPAEFIPLAEDIGLINELGDWVLQTACHEAAAWPAHIRLAVNVSPVQLKSQTLALRIMGALAASGLPPDRLEIEITEAVLIHDDETALAILHQLRAIGVRIALDDFGTGFSSLSYLKRFPFDKIKIDRCFVSDIEVDGSAEIVQAVVNIAASRNMTTTAEGVETEQQKQLLRKLGCTQMQGYLFSKPKPGLRGAAIARHRSAKRRWRRPDRAWHSGSAIYSSLILNSFCRVAFFWLLAFAKIRRYCPRPERIHPGKSDWAAVHLVSGLLLIAHPLRGGAHDHHSIGLAVCAARDFAGAANSQPAASQADAINALRQGGHVIVFRHGATHADQADTDPLNLSNVAKQRQLNDDGRALAKSIGESMRKLRIPGRPGSNQHVPAGGRHRHPARLRRRQSHSRYHRGRPRRHAEREQPAHGCLSQACRRDARGRHQHRDRVAQAEHHGRVRQGLVRRPRRRGIGVSSRTTRAAINSIVRILAGDWSKLAQASN